MIKISVEVDVRFLHRLGVGYYYGTGKLASMEATQSLMKQVLEVFLDDMAQLAQDNMENKDGEEPDDGGDATDSPEKHQ